VGRPGTPTRVRRDASSGATDTRQALIQAAIDSLRADGYGGASARTIAARAGCNQGLVFYHFGSVANLLLAALDEVSARRLKQYQAALDGVESPEELVGVAAAIFREDLDEGYVTVLAEMIAGASSTPGLGPEVAKRIKPWRAFATRAISEVLADTAFDGVVPGENLGHAVVALYLGLELLAHLDGDRKPAAALFDRAAKLAPLVAVLTSRGGGR
jgi:AcrR family transcriptional regulator